MDLLCFCSVLCLLFLYVRLFICALWSPAGKGLSNCEFVTFPLVSRIVSIPDLCTFTYFAWYVIFDCGISWSYSLIV